MKLPLLSAKEVIRILEKLGFKEIRQKGSHKYFKHADGRGTVIPFILEEISGEVCYGK